MTQGNGRAYSAPAMKINPSPAVSPFGRPAYVPTVRARGRSYSFARPLPEPRPRMTSATAVCLGLFLGTVAALAVILSLS